MNTTANSRRAVIKGVALAALASHTPVYPQGSAASRIDDPRERLESMIWGHELTQMICMAARLGIADHLKQGPRATQDLARVTSTHEDSLYRLLRTLAGFGIFAEDDARRFRLTPMAEFLRSDVPDTLRVTAQMPGEWGWQSWGNLTHSIRTGEPAFDYGFGKTVWEWLAQNPRAAALGNAFMTEMTTRDSRALLAAYDFRRFKRIIDVGGGQGSLLRAILTQNPEARGVLFEQPRVIESAKKVLDASVANRMELAPGDFFKSVPAGADLYILKNILHDWNDSQSREILRVCRKAMGSQGILLIIEDVVCGPNQRCRGKLADMRMLTIVGGRNRTQEEFSRLLKSSGFEMSRMMTSKGPHIVEAAPR